MPAGVTPERPRRLLMTADAVGGVWHYALDLAAELAGRGSEVTLGVVGPAPAASQRASLPSSVRVVETGLPLDWLAPNPASLRQAAGSLARLAEEIGADLVQLHAAAFANASFTMPVLVVHHSCLRTWWRAVRGDAPLPPEFAWRSDLTAAGLSAADLLIAPSAAFAAATAEAYGLAIQPLVVLNGRAAPPPADGAPATPVDVAFTAGRLWDEGKNIATLDAAASGLGAPFLAAGPLRGPDGPVVTLLHAGALGPVDSDEIRRLLAGRPVFASAALYEPFGLAVLEAAQAGCALVLSDIPTFRELWDGAAVLVSPRDADAFREAIRNILDDAPARSALGAAAALRAERYGRDAMAAGMLSAYATLAERGTGSGALEAAE